MQLGDAFEREVLAVERNQHESAATSALSVSSPSDGGESMKM